MSKTIYIKLTKIGANVGPFTIYDQWEHVIAENVPTSALIEGVNYVVDQSVILVKLVSTGTCTYEKTVLLSEIEIPTFYNTKAEEIRTGCVWKHLSNPEINHSFYGKTEPYIIEYIFANMNTEIVQSIQDYSRVFKYTKDSHGVSGMASPKHPQERTISYCADANVSAVKNRINKSSNHAVSLAR